MAVMTSAGSTFSASASLPATYDASGYNALTYTAVGEVTDMGEVGREYNIVNHVPLGNRRVQKLKGSYNSGSITLQFGRDFSDAGQVLLATARDSDSQFSFRMVLQNGKKIYFTGVVTSLKTNVGSVDNITGGSCQIELCTDTVEV